MKLLITAATTNEIAGFSCPAHNTDILITGAGIVSTLYHLQKRIQQVDYDMIIQAGIAGTFTGELQLGETVLVQQDTFGDLGAEEKNVFISLFEMGLADKDEFPFTNGWLVNQNKWLGQFDLKKVNAITVNTVSDDVLLKQQREKKFSSGIETMEGAALHYLCLQENIPFLQVRSISNWVGERDKAKWLMKASIENLGAELTGLVKKLND
jgi:futalosine hydrolase